MAKQVIKPIIFGVYEKLHHIEEKRPFNFPDFLKEKGFRELECGHFFIDNYKELRGHSIELKVNANTTKLVFFKFDFPLFLEVGKTPNCVESAIDLLHLFIKQIPEFR